MIVGLWQARNGDRRDHTPAPQPDRNAAAVQGVIGQWQPDVGPGDAFDLAAQPDCERRFVTAQGYIRFAPRPFVIVGRRSGQRRVKQGGIGRADVDDDGQFACQSGGNQRLSKRPRGQFVKVGEGEICLGGGDLVQKVCVGHAGSAAGCGATLAARGGGATARSGRE